jgi:hypothetical protein
MQIAPLWHATLRAFHDWWNDNCLLRLAASLAYYTALSLAPLCCSRGRDRAGTGSTAGGLSSQRSSKVLSFSWPRTVTSILA